MIYIQASTPSAQARPSVAVLPGGYRIEKWKSGRSFAIFDPSGELVCICVYKRGAQEVIRRLTESQ